jgi:hypothetical protein
MLAGTFNVPPRRGKGTRRGRQFQISSARSHPLNNEIDPARKYCHARQFCGLRQVFTAGLILL